MYFLFIYQEPVLFMKPTSSYLANGGTIEVPHPLSSLDHEVELAVVIGRKARDVSESNAMNYIGGYPHFPSPALVIIQYILRACITCLISACKISNLVLFLEIFHVDMLRCCDKHYKVFCFSPLVQTFVNCISLSCSCLSIRVYFMLHREWAFHFCIFIKLA